MLKLRDIWPILRGDIVLDDYYHEIGVYSWEEEISDKEYLDCEVIKVIPYKGMFKVYIEF